MGAGLVDLRARQRVRIMREISLKEGTFCG